MGDAIGLLSPNRAIQTGYQIPQLAGKVSFLARWLMSVAQSDDWGMIWSAYYPHVVSFSLEPYRTAWCYGSPGVARALWLAGQALGDLEIKQAAIHAIDACCRRPRERWRVTNAIFCHGLSGIVQILLRFYHDTGIKRFADFANLLVGDICNEFSIGLIYGFPNGRLSEEKRTQELLASEYSWQDSSAAFLLQGSAGIVLVLLAASHQVYPDWDSLFGLS